MYGRVPASNDVPHDLHLLLIERRELLKGSRRQVDISRLAAGALVEDQRVHILAPRYEASASAH